MKKLLILLFFLFWISTLYGQNIRRTISDSYNISGDSTLTVTLAFKDAGADKVKYSGFVEIVALADSLNGNGTFSASGTSDIESKPRFKLPYDIDSNESTLTWYTSQTDSSAVATNFTWKLGVNQWDFSISESDGVSLEYNFDAGDTLKVYFILLYRAEN